MFRTEKRAAGPDPRACSLMGQTETETDSRCRSNAVPGSLLCWARPKLVVGSVCFRSCHVLPRTVLWPTLLGYRCCCRSAVSGLILKSSQCLLRSRRPVKWGSGQHSGFGDDFPSSGLWRRRPLLLAWHLQQRNLESRV